MPSWQLDSRVPGIVLPGSDAYTQGDSVESAFGYPSGFCEASLSGASAATPCRTVPDVSAQADEYTGAITVYSALFGGWGTIGGTSSATPIWAAMLALVNDSAACRARSTTAASGVGFVSPLLYAVASDPAAYAASFNDITQGDNDIDGLDNGLTFPATTGYDLASGLGSPRLTDAGGTAGLAYYLCSLAGQSSRPAITSLSPAEVPTSGGSVTIDGSGFASGGGVAGITVGSYQVPAGYFTVTSPTSITALVPQAANTLPPGSPAPEDGAGPADVIVTLKNGEPSAATRLSELQYVDEKNAATVPSVTGLSPTGGSETAPTPVRILGSGFTGATKVTFGGIPATSFAVLSPYEIQVTPPAYSKSTRCAPSVAGETPTTDICQSQVQVTNANGASVLGTILKPLEGTLPALDNEAVFELPAGCGCEQEPAPTEFDYAPTPTVTSVSTSTAQPDSLASEAGGSLITVKGTGFDLLTLEWADLGGPALAASQDFGETYLTGTEMQIVANSPLAGDQPTIEPLAVPFSVRSIAGQSAPDDVTYAGIPNVTVAINTETDRNGGPDTGGSPVLVFGQGFRQAVAPILFAQSQAPGLIGTQYAFTVASDTKLTTRSVALPAGPTDVEVCSETGCSLNPPADEFDLYAPGNPVVTAVTPGTGPAAGATSVVIAGRNLGCVTSVHFGKVAATSFANVNTSLLFCGTTTELDATAPPGTAGAKVKVTVTTAESQYTGSGASASSATFMYAPASGSAGGSGSGSGSGSGDPVTTGPRPVSGGPAR
jgi:hypothetical protein